MKNHMMTTAKGSLAALVMALIGCSGASSPSTPPVPGVSVTPAAVTISESDFADSSSKRIAFVLTTAPTADVELSLTVSDSTEAEIKLPTGGYWTTGTWGDVSLTFTPTDWNVPQYLDIRGKDDTTTDGNQTSSINVAIWTTDATYAKVPKPSVSVTTIDDDTPGMTVDSAASLATAEGSTVKATFTVRLNTPPTADVTVPVTVNDVSEGQVALTSGGVFGSTVTLTFNSSTYATPKTVYIQSVDDLIADGNQTYTITVGKPTSTDSAYNALGAQTLSVVNSDNDTAGVTVTAASPLMTAEYGKSATFTVKLNTEPTANVVIPVTSTDITEGLVSGGSASTPAASLNLTFTPANWTSAQTVTVQGQDDEELGDNPVYMINVGAPTGATEYSALSVQTVSVLNADDDVADFVLSRTNLTTSESGSTATFSVSLNKAPSSNVVFQLAGDATEGSLQPSSLTFTPLDWQTAQTVTVTGQADFSVDGNVEYLVTVTPTGDVDYAALPVKSVTVVNSDIDTAAFTVSRTSMSISEKNAWDNTFTVRLNSMPSAPVFIPVTTSDAGEVLVKGGDSVSTFTETITLTFDSANWSAAQTVTIQGVDDFLIDGTQNVVLSIGAPTSADGNYGGLAAKSIAVAVSDSNSAGFTVTPTLGLITDETGLSATFSVRLNTIPSANVLIPVSVGSTDEALVSGGDVAASTPATTLMLTFTASDWSTPQVITVHGQDDAILDGPQAYTITVGKPNSADSNYNSLTTPTTVSATNRDNEAGVAETLSLSVSSLPHSGQVAKTTASFYTLSGLASGVSYRISATSLTDNANLYVYNSGTFASAICSSTLSAKSDEACTATSTIDGFLYVKIDGALTLNGAAFTLDANRVYTFETFPNGSGVVVDTVIDLYHSSDLVNPIASKDQGGVGNYSKMNVALRSGETYYLKVTGYYGSTGAYSVWFTNTATSGSSLVVTEGPEGEPDNTSGTAAPLALNTVADRYLTSSDVDWFVFTAP